MNVTYFGALVAGLLSFLSPCVLPLVPPYLCFLGGTTFDQLTGEDTVRQGILLLLVYSLGLGIPFIAAALAVRPFLNALQRFRPHLASVEKVLGGFLVLTGILFLTNSMTLISGLMLQMFPGLAKIG